MSTLPVKKYQDPILRKKSEEIKEITPEIKRLALDMIETMVENKGVGLAAPQIGVSKRIIVAQTEDGPRIFINPRILKKTKETEIMEEGCLCFPGLFLNIKRAKGIEFEALDENGKKVYLKLQNLPARVLQHEADHLEGILIIDKLGFWQRLKLKQKLKG